MWFKTILVATLCVAAYCEETKGKGGLFYAVKAWDVPEHVSIPNCYKVRMAPVEVEKLHTKCACQYNEDWDLDVFAFSPKEDQPSLNRTLVTNVVRDAEKVWAALTSDCKCDIFTSDATVPVLQPLSINKEHDFFIEYQLVMPPQMLGQINSPRDFKHHPVMAVLYCDHIPTAAEVVSATNAIIPIEGKLICDLVK